MPACAVLLLAACGGGGGETAPIGTAPPLTAPSITVQPVAVTVAAGSAATFSVTVTATGTVPPSYHWQLSTNSGTSWSSAPGSASSPSYSIQAVSSTDDGSLYRVQVSNAAGVATSNPALLTVTAVAQQPSVERQVHASTTDSNITAAPSAAEAPHVAINPSPTVSPRGRLLVFLPGTQGRPTQYTYILRAGASRGFHAVGVNYPNQTAMGTLCQFSTDPDCYWRARAEVVFGNGTPVGGQAPVARADAIVNRVGKLLAWLKDNHPQEGWGQFLLPDKTVDWSKVVLAGHSQGGGHVGVLAKTVSLGRAVYFSSPEDWNELADRPAGWTSSRPNVTPASLQYGFGADNDTLVPNAHAFAHWDAMGLSKPLSGAVLVDIVGTPEASSRQLRTSIPANPASSAPTASLRNHGITVVDASTPLDGNGKPLFDVNGVWEYLCFQ